MTTPLLEVDNLRTEFRSGGSVFAAVDGVSFSLMPGETLGIVGESGCGKSVTSLSIMRLVPNPPGRIASGAVRLQGRNLLDLPEAEMRAVRGDAISMIFQEPMTSLNPTLTVGFQIAEALRCHRELGAREAARAALELLEQVRIPNARERFRNHPHQFSGGMRQRVMIAMALACRPSLLIADEPTTALDVTIQAQILDLIRVLQAETALSVLFITHDMGVVAEIADRVAVMYRGDMVEEAARDDLFQAPAHPYTRMLLDAVPRLGSVENGRAAFGQIAHGRGDGKAPSVPAADGSPVSVLAAEPDALLTSSPQSGGAVNGGTREASGGHGGSPVNIPAAPAAEPDAQLSISPQPRGAENRGTGEASGGHDGSPANVPQPNGAPAVEPGARPAIDPQPRGAENEGKAHAHAAARDGHPASAAVTALPPPQPGALLDVAGLTVRFPVRSGLFNRLTGRVHAVENVSFAIAPRETLAFVGESGCGKSTIGRSLLGLIPTDSGRIHFEGEDITRLSGAALRARRRHMQVIFQDPFASLDPRQSIGAAIAEPIRVHGLGDARRASQKTGALLRKVGLDPAHAVRLPHEFSGGQRQRICIARALALEPRLIVADESVSALDVSIRARILDLMMQLQDELGLAFLFISHDIAVVERIAHRIAVLYLGEIVEIGPAQSVLQNPRHAYTRRLLDAVPRPDPARRRTTPQLRTDEIPSALRPASYAPPRRTYQEAAPGHYVQMA